MFSGMKISGIFVVILFTMMFLVDIQPIYSNTLCFQKYKIEKSKNNAHSDSLSYPELNSNSSQINSPILLETANLFGIESTEQAKWVETYSDKSLSEVKEELKAREQLQEQIKKLPAEKIAELKNVIEILAKSGFLLSPFHEILYLDSIPITPIRNQQVDFSREI